MAILYTPHGGDGSTIQFGGGTSGSLEGQPGPFPRYSLSREVLRAGDSTPLGSKFTINVTGTATIHEDDTQDITDKGARQSRIQGQAINNLQMSRAQAFLNGAGKLSIDPYGGKANKIIFTDARLLSVECQEQTEESAGIQTLEYSMSFEAYQDASSTSNNTTAIDAKVDPTYCMSAMDESWDVSENEGTVGFASSDISGTPERTYTLSQSVSGTGIKKFTSGGGGSVSSEAWEQCVAWVQSRLVDTPASVSTNIVGGAAASSYDTLTLGGGLGYALSAYTAVNKLRTVSTNLAEGSYSVTTTWLMVPNGVGLATHEADASVESSQDAQSATVTVNGTITGLSTAAPGNSGTNDKYTNASGVLSTVLTYAYTLANAAYTAAAIGGTLRNTQLNKSIGHNKSGGTITYSVSFNDLEPEISGALSESVTVNYDNEDGLDQIIAIIPIIGKADGPVIQDMGTTKEKKVSVTLDVVMLRGSRSSKPDGTTIANSYKPTSTSYQETKTESWSPSTGSYNLSISWIYI